jgi:hypothetical protein
MVNPLQNPKKYIKFKLLSGLEFQWDFPRD